MIGGPLSTNLLRLDAVRLFLYRELERADSVPTARGEDSMGDWFRRNRDELEPLLSDREENLLRAFEFVWGVSEDLAEKAGTPLLPLERLLTEGHHLLVGEGWPR